MALCKIKLPRIYKKLASSIEDPIDSECFGARTNDYAVIVMTFPADKQFAMPYDDLQTVIDSIRGNLSKEQAIVEVKGGVTDDNKKYAYSLVKNVTDATGVNYIAMIHIDEENTTSFIQIQAGSPSNSNVREKEIFEKLKKDGVIKDRKEGWAADPYDSNYKNDTLKNLSDNEEYDELYPDSPLSKIRELINFIIENN